MRTNIKICIVSTVIALSPAAIFANKDTTSNNGNYSIGMRISNHLGEETAIIAGYSTEQFLVDIGLNREDVTTNSGKKRASFSAHMHIGARYKLDKNTYFDYGLIGAHNISEEKNTDKKVDPYEYGTFIGLSWKPTKKLQMSMKISPYTFEKKYNRQETNHYFSEGSISTSYIF